MAKATFEFLTGPAGSGKTWTLRERVAADPNYGVLAATTGIAAVNLGQDCSTINSLLRYFDLEALGMSYRKGWSTSAIRRLSLMGYKNLIIEEASMLSAQQLEYIFASVVTANKDTNPLGLVLCGDLSQISPVNGDYIFDAPCFREFKTTKLTEIKRQSDPDFIKALNQVRIGRADLAIEYFAFQVGFHSKPDLTFNGTTIFGTNAEADRYNEVRLKAQTGSPHTYYCAKGGAQKPEWSKIPSEFVVKKGSLIMILANNPALGYANGDLAHVTEFNKDSVEVVLMRTNKVVVVKTVTRSNDDYDRRTKKLRSVGFVTYMPIRIAYGATAHKSQGLSLDAVQIPCGSSFIGMTPGGLYTALSRCRTAAGLRLIGSPSQLVGNCNVNTRVLPWL
jgi:ATP-dependent DNA helicase PIF1